MTATDVRFAFGENWASFSQEVGADRIERAVESMTRLFPNGELRDKAFFDIGCGSGLSMIAALHLGASSVHGIDLDKNSVTTARRLLGQHATDGKWTVEHRSVFDIKADQKFPIVHSWGVLHHTGRMYPAIEMAAKAVAPDGLLAIAIYRKTPLCEAWKRIKRVYNQSPEIVRVAMRGTFKATYLAGLAATRRNPISYVRGYQNDRGMSWSHDVHDWMGGYPYESASPDEITGALTSLGFTMERSLTKPVAAGGLFGSGCDEFVAKRVR